MRRAGVERRVELEEPKAASRDDEPREAPQEPRTSKEGER